MDPTAPVEPTPPKPSGPPRTYRVREIFHSLQGEGIRSGMVSTFLRFSHCNLQCSVEREGFNCDTDFQTGLQMTAEEIVAEIKRVDISPPGPSGYRWVVVTGGEPTLQFDLPLWRALTNAGYRMTIETNGTKPLKANVDFVSVSPKRGHPCVLQQAHECRIVLAAGQVPDEHQMAMAERSMRKFVSPAFKAPPADLIQGYHAGVDDLDYDAIAWCVDFVLKNPTFAISLQTHKILSIR